MADQTLAARLEDAAEEQRVYAASQWQLMWWRFRKHTIAQVALIILILFYGVSIFAEFLATTETRVQDANRSYISPQPVHWFDGWRFSPHVFPVEGVRDPVFHEARVQRERGGAEYLSDSSLADSSTSYLA